MVAEARARLSLDSKPFVNALGDIQGQVEGKFTNSIKSVGTAIAGAFTIHTATKFIKDALAMGDQIDNLSNKIGISVEAVQALQQASKEAGIDFGQVEGAILKLNKASVDAQSGNKNLASAFQTLGISMKDLQSLNTEQLFDAVARSMSNGAGDANVLNAAFDVLGGRSGPALQKMLMQVGEDGLPGLIDEFKNLGLIVDAEGIKKLDQAEQTLSRFFDTIKKGATSAFADWLNAVSRNISYFRGTLIEYDEAQQAIIDTANRKVQEFLEAQRAAADEQKRLTDGIKNSFSAMEKLNAEELKRAPAAERLAALRKEEKQLIELTNQLVAIGSEEELKKINAKIRLLSLGDEIKKLEKEINAETGKGNEKKEKSASLAKQQLDNFNTLKNTIRGLTDRELADFLTKMQSIAYAIAGLSDIPKDKLAWVSDLAKLEFKGLTTSQADQMVRALTSLINGLSDLSGKVPADMLDFLGDLNNLKFSGLTSGQASQMVRAVETLINGLKGFAGTDLSFITDLMNSLQGATPGKYEIAISLPDEFKDGFPLVLPDGMEGNLDTIAKNLETLAGLKGVVWA
jgi:hypothetical protein